jgi:4-hydroxy 2-oxovalerate aldolase
LPTAAKLFAVNLPSNNAVTIVSGLAGVFSGFAKPVLRIAKEMNLDPRDIFFALGQRKVVGGQEDLILEAAQELARLKQASAPQT